MKIIRFQKIQNKKNITYKGIQMNKLKDFGNLIKPIYIAQVFGLNNYYGINLH
jgi:hypothetical protein